MSITVLPLELLEQISRHINVHDYMSLSKAINVYDVLVLYNKLKEDLSDLALFVTNEVYMNGKYSSTGDRCYINIIFGSGDNMHNISTLVFLYRNEDSYRENYYRMISMSTHYTVRVYKNGDIINTSDDYYSDDDVDQIYEYERCKISAHIVQLLIDNIKKSFPRKRRAGFISIINGNFKSYSCRRDFRNEREKYGIKKEWI